MRVGQWNRSTIVNWLHDILDQTLLPMNRGLWKSIGVVGAFCFCISTSHGLTVSGIEVSQIVRSCGQKLSIERRQQKDKMQPHTCGLYIVHSDSCYFMRALSAASRCILSAQHQVCKPVHEPSTSMPSPVCSVSSLFSKVVSRYSATSWPS